MRLLWQREAIRDTIRQWADHDADNERRASIQAQMRTLDPESATVADLDAILAPVPASAVQCDECGARADLAVAIAVGEPIEEYRESATARLCGPCLARAVDLMKAVP
jgi:hypothetical protein